MNRSDLGILYEWLESSSTDELLSDFNSDEILKSLALQGLSNESLRYIRRHSLNNRQSVLKTIRKLVQHINLKVRGFSNKFIQDFEYMSSTQLLRGNNDVIAIYFSKDISLSQIEDLETALNTLFLRVLGDLDDKVSDKVIQVRKVSYRNSVLVTMMLFTSTMITIHSISYVIYRIYRGIRDRQVIYALLNEGNEDVIRLVDSLDSDEQREIPEEALKPIQDKLSEYTNEPDEHVIIQINVFVLAIENSANLIQQ